MNIVWTDVSISLEWVVRRGISGSHGSSTVSILRRHQAVSEVAHPFIFPQHWMKVFSTSRICGFLH